MGSGGLGGGEGRGGAGGSSSDSTTSNSNSSHSPNADKVETPRTPSPTEISSALKRKSDDCDMMGAGDIDEHKQPRLDSQISS